jgi:hypothetical protein
MSREQSPYPRKPAPRKAPPRKGRRQRLNKVTARLLGPALRRQGITINRIITEWPQIAGDASGWCEPASINFTANTTNNGTLTVNVASGRGPEMQMMTADIIRKVNQVFGYGAISRITISQTTLPLQTASSLPKYRQKITPELAEKFTQERQNIDPNISEDLRKALDNLGKSLSGDQDTP